MNTEKIALDESVIMCSGVCCPIREKCYRYRLNHFFGFVAKKAHSNPQFCEPQYDAQSKACSNFVTPVLKEAE